MAYVSHYLHCQCLLDAKMYSTLWITPYLWITFLVFMHFPLPFPVVQPCVANWRSSDFMQAYIVSRETMHSLLELQCQPDTALILFKQKNVSRETISVEIW